MARRSRPRTLRQNETFCTRTNQNGREQTEAREREDRSKTERTGAHRSTFTALWTTLSGFKSLPPSQITLSTSIVCDRLVGLPEFVVLTTLSGCLRAPRRCRPNTASLNGLWPRR